MLGGGGGTISWLPRVQKVTATASSESEYVIKNALRHSHS